MSENPLKILSILTAIFDFKNSGIGAKNSGLAVFEKVSRCAKVGNCEKIVKKVVLTAVFSHFTAVFGDKNSGQLSLIKRQKMAKNGLFWAFLG